jgi:hypothetical protein
MLPLYGFLEGDTLGLLVLAEESDTAAVLVDKLVAAARVRVAPRANLCVIHEGKVLDARTTVASAGIQALDRFDVAQRCEGARRELT